MADNTINRSILSFPVTFEKTEDVSEGDCRFTKVKIWLMHLGANANNSVFEKSVVDKELPTLEYIPIVGFLEKNKADEDDFSDHRYIITRDKNGLRRKYTGSAYGVITSTDDNNAHYEDRECDDGVTRTFLVVDGLLWNMFEDSSEVINRDLIKSHSMELWDDEDSVDGYTDENGLFHFTKFSFRAACILGNYQEPAMMNSTIEVQFSMKDFMKEMQSELSEKFNAFSKIINTQNQGGTEVMSNTDFTQTALEQFQDISNIVAQYENIENRWGEQVPRYYLRDIQDNQVIVVDKKNSYQIYGFSFSINGDKPEIDFSDAKRKKLQYTDYDDGSTAIEGAFDFGEYINQSEAAAAAKIDKLTTDYSTLKSDYENLKKDHDTIMAAEQARINTEISAKKDAEFTKYEGTLSENPEFLNLKLKKDELSFEDIESKCAIIFAKTNLTGSNFSKSGSTPQALTIPSDDGDDKSVVTSRYGIINKY